MAARSMWSGSITFGLLSVPVKLFGATESKDLAFHNLHAAECHSRIKQKTYCPVCDVEVPRDQLQRAYEYSKGSYVAVNDEDLEALQVPGLRTIELDSFVDAGEIERRYTEKTYWLEPEEVGAKPYRLLLEAIEQRGVVGVGKIVLSKKEHICTIRAHDGVLVLEVLFWPDELRVMDSGTPQPAVSVSEAEASMAGMLIDMLRKPFTPSAYVDTYRLATLEMIETKRNGGAVAAPAAVAKREPLDMMAALKASIAASQAKKAA